MLRSGLPSALFALARMVRPYPPSMAEATEMIPDATAFFPGGKGLWTKEESDVFPSILVLGQDFGTHDEHQDMLKGKARDLNCSTWRNLMSLFDEAGIGLTDCFFSNVFMGVRIAKSSMGRCPGFRDKGFTERNLDFLKFQIETIKPRIIITLGLYAARMLANVSPDCLGDWGSAKRFKDISDGLKEGVTIGSGTYTCVCLVHPCMRHANLKHRRYGNHEGHSAELRMLRDAVG